MGRTHINLLVSCLIVIICASFLGSALEILLYMSVYEGMNAELLCSAGSTISEGQFMWQYEQNSLWETVAIRDGPTLQESFRKKIYDKDKARGILSNNLTINEKFNGRVNITSDGNLVLMNSTVQDGGNYKCSYQGFTGPVEESLVNLSVKLLKVTDDKTVETSYTPTLQIFKDYSVELHRYKVAVLILATFLGLLTLLVAVFVGYTLYKRLTNHGRDEVRSCGV